VGICRKGIEDINIANRLKGKRDVRKEGQLVNSNEKRETQETVGNTDIFHSPSHTQTNTKQTQVQIVHLSVSPWPLLSLF
jgi:hypothetical protein